MKIVFNCNCNCKSLGIVCCYLCKQWFRLYVHEYDWYPCGLRRVKPCIGACKRVLQIVVPRGNPSIGSLGKEENRQKAARIRNLKQLTQFTLPFITNITIQKRSLGQRSQHPRTTRTWKYQKKIRKYIDKFLRNTIYVHIKKCFRGIIR